jgi:hypothetical protein
LLRFARNDDVIDFLDTLYPDSRIFVDVSQEISKKVILFAEIAGQARNDGHPLQAKEPFWIPYCATASTL